ncbi:hypothetical protein LCGC14_2886030 [marine sediment metagenome]|uniref:Phage tail protein n=1 Tax=marine sediment metagenome TaxID=412755 RepID=A0A0F8XYN1_9ZZZZ
MVTAIASVGIQLQVGDGAGPDNFTDVPKVVSGNIPGVGKELIETTSLDSTGGNREYIPSFNEQKIITCPIFFVPDNTIHNGLWTDAEDGTLRNFKIILTDTSGTTYSFAAYVKLEGNFATGEAVQGTLELSVSGAVVKS